MRYAVEPYEGPLNRLPLTGHGFGFWDWLVGFKA